MSLANEFRVGVTRREVTFNQDLRALVPTEGIDADYVARFLQANQKRILGLVDEASHGTKRLTSDRLNEIQIPVPPILEQRRVAAILDRADALRVKRRAAVAQLDTAAQAIFEHMFGDPVTNPKGWPEGTTLGEVADITSGVTKGRRIQGKATRVVPYLAVSNVQDRSLDLSFVKTIAATDEEIARYRLSPGDLLLTEGGDPDKLGRGTLWKGQIADCIHQNHIFRVRLVSKLLQPLFLNWLVGSARGKRYFLKSAKQTTGIASINMTQLRGFPLMIPPIEAQEEFARCVAIAERVAGASAASVSELDTLFASLQHRAFRGEL